MACDAKKMEVCMGLDAVTVYFAVCGPRFIYWSKDPKDFKYGLSEKFACEKSVLVGLLLDERTSFNASKTSFSSWKTSLTHVDFRRFYFSLKKLYEK